jgi:uncharacterized protein (DUF1697 family)
MTIYIALLRGINVGSKNRLKMDDLRKTLQSVGFNKVETYIQSGNVLFESEEEAALLQQRMVNEIEKVFGISTKVILRTKTEVDQIIDNCPFSEKEIKEAEVSSDGESLYVSLLDDILLEEQMKRLSILRSDHEEYRVEGKEIYLLFRRSIRNSKLASYLQKLDVPSTVRNWKTMNKLSAMAKQLENKA